MSWFGNLAETYYNCENIWGINDNENILPPPYFLFKNIGKSKDSNGIRITLDKSGNLKHAEPFSGSVIIPYTPEAEARTSSTSAPYPLHEQMKYLAYYDKYYDAYMEQLRKWCNFHDKVKIVYQYLSKKTILDDLEGYKFKNLSPKTFVMFSVWLGLESDLWKDETIVDAWIKYCKENEGEDKNKGLCYATGEVKTISKYSQKISGNSKLICFPSDKEDPNFVYSGRFFPIANNPTESRIIGKESSHAAMSMLKYLISAQNLSKCGSQAIVAWAIDNGEEAISFQKDSCEFFGNEEPQTDSDKLIETKGVLNRDYAHKLRELLNGCGSVKKSQTDRKIVVLATDSEGDAPLAITFYCDLDENEYIERIINWHETCCWNFRSRGKKGKFIYDKNGNPIYHISAPSTDKIIAAVYGEKPPGEAKSYYKIKKQARERILSFILNSEKFDKSWLNAAVNRVSNPFSFIKKWESDKDDWENHIGVVCAMGRKYYYKEEVFALGLDRNNKDKDYLFGRLLAVADTIERKHLQKKKDDRPTNAIRYMSAFKNNPYRTWGIIREKINYALVSLKSGGREWYQQEIDSITELLFDPNISDKEYDKPLTVKYLFGYSLQRKYYADKDKEYEENKKRIKEEQGNEQEDAD
ncbi:MAG: type I-C CRISPR-associated protein Cas8c/Csd1 [Oscillospiraceae bacterium]|nr:type I-C CRISPR-associated protein Cas8c/Csd1 [Oscillospiraceae bacterium]